MDFRKYTVTINDADRRLDRIVRRFLPGMSLSGIYKLMRKGLVRLDGKKADPATRALEGSEVWIASGLTETGDIAQERRADPVSEYVPEIVFENRDFLFINKPAGIAVHGKGGLDALIAQDSDALQSLSFRTGPLHRLDRDTTGILAFSRSLEGARWFSAAVHDHALEKYYLGLAEGFLAGDAEWRDRCDDGKEMITLASPVARSEASYSGSFTLIRYRIITGRKHQIRIQTSLHGHPLAGDSRYGGAKTPDGRYCLHARELVFPQDRLACLPERIFAPIPARFSAIVREIFGKDLLAQLERDAVYWNEYDEHQ